MSEPQIAPADQTAWYRTYWDSELMRLGVVLGIAGLVGLALVLHFVVTVPIIEALKGAGSH